jgi:hypothetical protein
LGLARRLGMGWLGMGWLLGLRLGMGLGLGARMESVLGLATVLFQPVVVRQS